MLKKGDISNSVSGEFEIIDWQDKFSLECYGSRINIRTDQKFLRSKLKQYLPIIKQEAYLEDLCDTVSFIINQDKDTNGLYYNNELAMDCSGFDDTHFEFAADKILMIMAMVSLPSKIYLHAGAVVWKGLGILMPGISRAGKTTLVKEFIEAGADFYSDDCIILDDANNICPFPRALSIRTENGKIFREASYYGSKIGIEKAKVDLILFACYQKNGFWNAKQITLGESVLKLMDNFYIRSSVGNAPSEIIKILKTLTSQAMLYGGERGEASQVVDWVSREFLS